MIETNDELYKDFDAIRRIPIVSTMLDVICANTGLGFAAIARVTKDRWLTCGVRDDVAFGLKPGDELKIETTICNEIRDSREPVIIDHVAEDEHYRDHHTPKLYGLQSYISFPIILKNGEFFGTLCAIGSEPAQLDTPAIKATFKLFSELIAFHLQSMDLMKQSTASLQEVNRQLTHSYGENLLYRKIANHNLQEPLRKLRFLSDRLLSETYDQQKTAKTAQKVSGLAKELSDMIHHTTLFSSLAAKPEAFEQVELGTIMEEVAAEMTNGLAAKNAVLEMGALPALHANPEQLKRLFTKLTDYLLDNAAANGPSVIRMSASEILPDDAQYPLPPGNDLRFCGLSIALISTDFRQHNVEDIFDIFVHLNAKDAGPKYGEGLADCRKIVHYHGGLITAGTIPGAALSFSLILPLDQPV